jgi:hypothetical protein
MANALTNPYEITAGGVMVKCTPYTGGSFITNRDLPKDVALSKQFKDALFAEYNIHQEPELDGIKVLGKKENEDGSRASEVGEARPESGGKARK